MDRLDSITKTFDKLFVITVQNIFGYDIKICKWSFLITAFGVGINILINSFYLIKITNENDKIKNKINLLLNEQKVIIEGNITIYEFIKENIKYNDLFVEDKPDSLLVNDCVNDCENDCENDCDYDFLNSQ